MTCVKRFRFFCLTMVLVCWPILAFAAPKAELAETSFDFGLISENRENVHPFTIKNTGDADLVIKRIVTDCGCTTTKYDRTIAPGAEGTVYVTLNTIGYRGHSLTRSIKIYFNNDAMEPVVLTVTANVSEMVTLEPHRVSFTGHANEELVSVVTITPLEAYPFKITSVAARFSSNINYNLKETLENGKIIYKLTVTNIRSTAGRYFDEIVITTDNPAVGDISIRVNGQILSGGVYTPNV